MMALDYLHQELIKHTGDKNSFREGFLLALEIFSPSFEEASPSAKYAAMDIAGDWFFHSEKPEEICENQWYNDGGHYEVCALFPNWRNSIVKRPE